MQPRPENIGILRKHSFHAYSLEQTALSFQWHLHPELELTYIEKGKGRRFVGDDISRFREGDLVLLGPNLPHSWMGRGSNDCIAHVVQFRAVILKPFAEIPEFKKIASLCSRASGGLSFRGAGRTRAGSFLRDLQHTKGSQQVIAFMQLFHTLSALPYQVISRADHFKKPTRNDSREYRTMFYIHRNWNKEPQIADISRELGLTETAFCHFFKRMTGKTFSECINDTRIANLCHTLLDSDDPMPLIAAGAGFRNLSYFNRVFRDRMGMTPMAFRKKHAPRP